MAKREISIVLKAKNELQVGLAKAKKAVSDFGDSALRIGKLFAGAFLSMGTAIAGFAAKAISSYAEAEKAENAVRQSFIAFGEEVEANTERINIMAAAIQNETGVSDERTKLIAAQLKTYGVQTEELEKTTKAVIALTRAGMGEEQAMRAMVLANNGNYQALQRAIPQLRLATEESEKARITQDFLTRQYDAQKAQLNTLGGQYGLLKERIGDAWEEAGAAIASNDLLRDAVARVSEEVLKLGEAIKNWALTGGIENATAAVKHFENEVSYRFAMVGNTIKGNIAVIHDFIEPFLHLGEVGLKTLNVLAGAINYVGELFVAAAEKAMHPWREFKAPDTTPIVNAFTDLKNTVMESGAFTIDKTMEAQSERNKIEKDYAERSQQIMEEHMSALDANTEKQIQKAKTRAEANKAIEESAAADSIALSESTSLAIQEDISETADVEIESTEKVAVTNKSAAESVRGYWDETYAAIASASQRAAQTQIDAANSVANAGANGGGGYGNSAPPAKSSLSTSTARTSNPSASIPERKSVVGDGASSSKSSFSNDEVVYELRKIRTQNEKLLTYS